MKAGISAAAALIAVLLVWWAMVPVSVELSEPSRSGPDHTILAQSHQSQAEGGQSIDAATITKPVAADLPATHTSTINESTNSSVDNGFVDSGCVDSAELKQFTRYLSKLHNVLGGTEAANLLRDFGADPFDANYETVAQSLGIADWEVENWLSDALVANFLERHRLYGLLDQQAASAWNDNWAQPAIAQFTDASTVLCNWGACLVVSGAQDQTCWSEALNEQNMTCATSFLSPEKTATVIVNSTGFSLANNAEYLATISAQACPSTAAQLTNYQQAMPFLIKGLPFEQLAPTLASEQSEFVSLARDLLLPHWPNAEDILSNLATSQLGDSTIPLTVQKDMVSSPSDFATVYTDEKLRAFLRASLAVTIDQPILCGATA